ncbi:MULTISPECIES: hypothetical protein [Dysgonomonas]|uniref:hypothetical protein n=1 Tax=Dysgonomonas TaxID=156973 RepID=UPI0025C0426C|nr:MULTISPECIES: hypothetical protein [Dysgonomonas]
MSSDTESIYSKRNDSLRNMRIVGRRLTRLIVYGWDWNEFWVCANIIKHENLSLRHADVFLMGSDMLVVPCENFLGRYTIE